MGESTHPKHARIKERVWMAVGSVFLLPAFLATPTLLVDVWLHPDLYPNPAVVYGGWFLAIWVGGQCSSLANYYARADARQAEEFRRKLELEPPRGSVEELRQQVEAIKKIQKEMAESREPRRNPKPVGRSEYATGTKRLATGEPSPKKDALR